MNGLTRAVVAALVSVCGLAACGSITYAPIKYSGELMTNNAGMTLYTFDKDAADSGKSACNGPCAVSWPPFAAGADDKSGGDWTVITRDDGSKQWAKFGKLLYLYARDQKPGDTTGDGFNNVWHAYRAQRGPTSGAGAIGGFY